MLLVADIGNSNIVIGVFDEARLRASWRLTSRLNATVDEYCAMLGSLLQRAGLGEPGSLSASVLASVVPPLTQKIGDVLEALGVPAPLIVGPGVKTGLDIRYEDPREVGADRIANAVGALTRHSPPFIVVDFGTATTFEVTLPPNVFIGGIIVPGLYVTRDALVSHTALLPKVELRPVDAVVGRTTAESIRSGLYHGSGAMVDGLIERIAAEQNIEPLVIATGGIAALISGASKRIQHVEPDLTLRGLREIWLKNG
jgi:type III pantothenate kinase